MTAEEIILEIIKVARQPKRTIEGDELTGKIIHKHHSPEEIVSMFLHKVNEQTASLQKELEEVRKEKENLLFMNQNQKVTLTAMKDVYCTHFGEDDLAFSENLNKQITSLKQQLEEVQSDRDNLRSISSDMEGEIRELKESNATLREWYSEKEEENVKLKQQIEEYKKEVKRLEKVEQSLKDSQLSYQKQAGDLKQQLKEMAGALDILDTCLEEAPIDFLGTGDDLDQAIREKKAWRKKWKDAYKSALSKYQEGGKG